MKPITLIGLPGSGKSSVGAFLARKMGCLFHDTDHALEDLLGCSIRCYFEKNGEAAFRDAETQVLDLLTKEKKNGVLATGGGVILRALNRQYLRERTLVIYLKATPEQLARRLRHDTKRPLLQVADPLARLRALYAERDPLYREVAHFTVETRDKSVALLASRVMAQLELAGYMPGR